jgi:hypothetical protein
MTRERFIVAAGVIGLAVLTIALYLSSLASVRNVRLDSFQRTADPHKKPGPRLLLGIAVPILVSLKQPLQGRSVLDYDGSPVRDLGQYFAPGSTPAP